MDKQQIAARNEARRERDRARYARSKVAIRARRSEIVAAMTPEQLEQRRVAALRWRQANPVSPDGIPSRRPEYVKAYVHNYRKTETGRRVLRESARQFRASRRALLDTLKSAPCAACGESFPPIVMDFHHRDPKEKLFNVSLFFRVNKEVLLAEVAKCDVVCANCHRIEESLCRSVDKLNRSATP